MAVPCELVTDPVPHKVQTYVIKAGSDVEPEVLRTWAHSQAVLGAGAWALAEIRGTSPPGTFLVITVGESCFFESRAARIKGGGGIKQLPAHPAVEWVRPLTRRFQRYFGSGDVCATVADVRQACEKDDKAELKAIMPQAAAVIDRAGCEILAPLFTALHGAMPQLADCEHEFFQEAPFQRVLGPCARGEPGGAPGSRTHVQPYTRCKRCKLVLCGRCAADSDEEQRQNQELRAALHEARQVPAPTYWQHPERPPPFYVVDQHKVPYAEKLQWLKQELGADADLPTFSAKFVELFGERLHGRTPQKRARLALYAKYARSDQPAMASKESDLPPADLEEFQKVWDPDAPGRCRECGKALAPDAPFGQLFCGMACQAAGKTIACNNCCPPLLKLTGEDPLELLRQMAGDGADLPVFVAAVRKLVAERQVAMPQKGAALKLYAEYAPELSEARAWREERGLPPSVLTQFREAWGAPPEVVLRNGSLACKVCGRGAESAGKMARGAPKGLEETELGKSIKRNAESLQMASNIWGVSAVSDPDHKPAWKKRRRS